MFEFIKDARRNIFPPYLSDKIIVIESDDWGAECVSDQSIFKALIKKGLPLDKDPYSKFDNIASQNDLYRLFDVLQSFKDREGNSPIITANINMGNPDYDKIKADSFDRFHWISLRDTLKKHSKQKYLLDIWKSGIESGVFYPQLHGREHLNVIPWLKALKCGEPEISSAFDFRISNINVSYGVGNRKDYRAAFDFENIDETQFHKEAIVWAYNEFSDVFGFNSRSFIAPCYTWSQIHEQCLNSLGVDLIQGASNYKNPQGFGNPYNITRNSFFAKNDNNQVYISRNVMFEPSQETNRSQEKILDRSLSQIKNAFLFGKPAVISFHRLNIIGNRVQKNADVNLQLLNKLFTAVLKKWPDVKFKKTVELL
jgi:hypothetical protein